LSQVGILIIDDDISSQRALKNVLDGEGWRVRIVPLASHAMAELATGEWSLAIVNLALLDLRGPLFSVLKDLIHAQFLVADGAATAPRKLIRIFFLVPLATPADVLEMLEREGLPYLTKPYHLHDFLEKVSEMLAETGAIAAPLRSVGGFAGGKKRRREARIGRDLGRGAMFASREDYQMTEEEIAEFEREEETRRKKRKKPSDQSF